MTAYIKIKIRTSEYTFQVPKQSDIYIFTMQKIASCRSCKKNTQKTNLKRISKTNSLIYLSYLNITI